MSKQLCECNRFEQEHYRTEACPTPPAPSGDEPLRGAALPDRGGQATARPMKGPYQIQTAGFDLGGVVVYGDGVFLGHFPKREVAEAFVNAVGHVSSSRGNFDIPATHAPFEVDDLDGEIVITGGSSLRKVAVIVGRNAHNARLICEAVNEREALTRELRDAKAWSDAADTRIQELKAELALFKQAVERCNKEHDPLRSTLNAMRGAMSKIYGLYSKSPDEAAFKIADAALKAERDDFKKVAADNLASNMEYAKANSSLRSEVAALRGALKNMVERFEEKTGERPHNGDMCGCSYCNAKLALKGDDADRPTCLYCKSTEAEWCGPKDGHREYVCLKCAKGMSRD